MDTTAKIKFENDKDFVDGCIEMGKTLDTWKNTADEGVTRNFRLSPNGNDLTLEIFLEVLK